MKDETHATAIDGREISTLTDPLHDGWGWYLYGVTRIESMGTREYSVGLGLDSKPVQAFPYGDLVAFVSPVLLDALGVEAIRSRLLDTNSAGRWIEEAVRSHERVVEAAQHEWGVLPARFGCIFTSTGDLESGLMHGHDPLLAQLRRLEGCDEWGVKFYADRTTIQRCVASEMPAVLELRQELAAAGPGRSYFLQRKLADVVAVATDQSLSDIAQQAYDLLSGRAVGTQLGVTPRSGVSSTSESEILRAAFLVRRSGIDAFVEETHRFTERQEGLRCEYSGPWPAYSFAALGKEELE